MSEKEISDFSLKCVSIMTHMLKTNTVEDDVLNTLRELELEYYSLLDKNRLLEGKINIDSKTNLLKYSDDYLIGIIKTASRVLEDERDSVKAYKISYIRFDLDDFSVINNTYGHDAGDEVLIDFANLLKEESRPTDLQIRFGGEEFDIILPTTDISGTEVVLKRLYNTAKEKLNYNFKGENVQVTMSAGISIYSIPYAKLRSLSDNELKEEYKELQKRADNALYHAKATGKNQYKVYDESIDYDKIRSDYAQSK